MDPILSGPNFETGDLFFVSILPHFFVVILIADGAID